jgi:hypothetical protein
MANNKKHKDQYLFPSLWQVKKYRHLWRERIGELHEDYAQRWEKEICDKVMKVFFYEEYERIMNDDIKFYDKIFETLAYFYQLRNIKAVENIAWKLKTDPVFEKDFKGSLLKENYERLIILKLAQDVENKPNAYKLEIDSEFEIQRQEINDDFRNLIEMKEKEPKKPENIEDEDKDYCEESLGWLLLGMSENYYNIINVLQHYEQDKDIIKQITWTIALFYKDWIDDINNEFDFYKNLKALKMEAIFSMNENAWEELEKVYFSKMHQLAIENVEIGPKALVAILKHYDNVVIKQKSILSSIEPESLSKGIKYAIEIEEYEIAQQLKLYLDMV